MAARLIGLGWLNPIAEDRWSNKKNMRPDLLNAKADLGRKFTAPYVRHGGLAYNKAAIGRDVTKLDDLWIRPSRARSASSAIPRTGWA